jgi:hypothetical protein
MLAQRMPIAIEVDREMLVLDGTDCDLALRELLTKGEYILCIFNKYWRTKS